jgi:hypothetical protein
MSPGIDTFARVPSAGAEDTGAPLTNGSNSVSVCRTMLPTLTTRKATNIPVTRAKTGLVPARK